MAHKPDVISLPLSYYVNKLRNNEPFTFARYGDGEILTILGHHNLKNSNGCSFTPELSEALQQAVKNQHSFYGWKEWKYKGIADTLTIGKDFIHKGNTTNYQYSLLHITRRKQGHHIVKWLSDNNITMPWYNGDIFLDESLKGKLFPLVEQIRKKRVLYVGNKRLRDLRMNRAGFFDYVAYVEPPPLNAFTDREHIIPEVARIINENDINFIGWSAGLAAKYFIDEIYMLYPDITQIDFGSQFDGYFKPLPHIKTNKYRKGGMGSRSYIRSGKYDFKELWRKNTGR